jgi:hypothetical protein
MIDPDNPLINECRMFRCEQTWEQLDLTANSKARFCSGCDKFVFLCQNSYEVDYHGRQSHCIAAEFEHIKIYKIGYWILPYSPPKLTLYLKPIYDLNQSQLNFLSHSFNLIDPDYRLRNILCDGRKHILATNVTPFDMDGIQKELIDRKIGCEFEIDPD